MDLFYDITLVICAVITGAVLGIIGAIIYKGIDDAIGEYKSRFRL